MENYGKYKDLKTGKIVTITGVNFGDAIFEENQIENLPAPPKMHVNYKFKLHLTNFADKAMLPHNQTGGELYCIFTWDGISNIVITYTVSNNGAASKFEEIMVTRVRRTNIACCDPS